MVIVILRTVLATFVKQIKLVKTNIEIDFAFAEQFYIWKFSNTKLEIFKKVPKQ